jgi:hypothetical protein
MFIKRIIISILATFTLVWIIGAIFDYRYKKRWQFFYFDKMELLQANNPNFDIIFLGNSRIHFGINPYYVDSITGLTSYNFGQGAADAEEMLMYSTLYLANHTPPKYAFINLDPATLIKTNRLKNRYAYLFMLNNDTIYSYMKRNGFYTTLIKHQPYFKYSFFDEYNRTSIFVKGKNIPHFKHTLYNGFINPHQNITTDTNIVPKVDKTILNFNPDADNINDTAAATIKKTIELFQKKGSRVILLYAPGIKPTEEKFIRLKQQTDSTYNKLSRETGLAITDINDYFFFSRKYFVDQSSHMNIPGAKIFSELVGNYINTLQKK